MADYEAAQSAGVDFIGIQQNDTHTFGNLAIPTISHHNQLEKVLSEEHS